MKRIIFIVLSCLLSLSVSKAEVVLPDPGPSLDYSFVKDYLTSLNDASSKKRGELLKKAEESAEAMSSYVQSCREKYFNLVGVLPEKTDLHAEVTGRNTGNGWREENIVYQSIPGRYVTALLFLPENASEANPVPCVVMSCGHNTKASKRKYSVAATYLAQNGVACIVVDPFGQGERIQNIDSKGRSLTRIVTVEHGLENLTGTLVGEPLFARILWDNMRAIDYVQSRSDIDGTKIGAMGTSGGATQSLLLTAYDERIIAAVMSSANVSGTTSTGYDGCSVIPGISAANMTMTDIAMTICPRPFVYMDGLADKSIPHSQNVKAIPVIKKAYKLQGFDEDSVSLLTVPTGHDLFVKDKMEGMVRFFSKHLLGQENTAWVFPGYTKDDELRMFPEDKFNCTKTGRVLLEYPDAKSLFQENMDRFEAAAKTRKKFMSLPYESIKDKIYDLLGMEKSESKIKVKKTVSNDYGEYSFEAFRIEKAGEPPVPCALICPKNMSDDTPVNIWLYDGGKNKLLSSPQHIELALKTKGPVLVADIRGFGETEPVRFKKGDFNTWNNEYPMFQTGLFQNKSLLGQRVSDVFSIVDFCKKDKDLKDRKIRISANGEYVPVVIHAVYLDERIDKAELAHGSRSWRQSLYPLQRDICASIVPGIINYYDIRDLYDKCKKRISVLD